VAARLQAAILLAILLEQGADADRKRHAA